MEKVYYMSLVLSFMKVNLKMELNMEKELFTIKLGKLLEKAILYRENFTPMKMTNKL